MCVSTSRRVTAILLALALVALGVLAPPISAPVANAAVGQVFLPNVTKTFGGTAGWTTPIVVQNTGITSTDVSLSFYRFSDGSAAGTIRSPLLRPGQSWTFDPRSAPELPNDTQFSVVLQASSGSASAIVVEGQGDSWMAYAGTSGGAATVYLPNVTRRLGGVGGWDTPFIVQNLGPTATTISVTFYRFADGSQAKRIDNVVLQPGRARDFVPWAIDGLADDTQYAVVVQGPAGSQLYAVVNEVQGRQAMSYEGLLAGGEIVYLPNVLKYLGGSDHWSTPFIVQNVGAAQTSFSLEFYAFAGGALVTRVDNISLLPGRSHAVDVRFSPASLPAGSYSVVVRGAKGAQLGAVVNQVDFGAGVAMAYDGITQALPSAYLPYVQKNSGAARWFSPIIAQNLGSAAADITISLFDAAGELASQRAYPAVAPGAAAVLDPRFDRRLRDGVYSALVQSAQPVAAVANHAGSPGDHGMSNTSIPGQPVGVPVLPAPTLTNGPLTFRVSYGLSADVYVDASMNPADTTRIVALVDADTTSVQSDLGRTFTRPPAIYVFGNEGMFALGIQTLLKTTPQDALETSQRTSAFYSPSLHAILLNWQDLSADHQVTAIRHELTHLLTHQLVAGNPTLPAWLDEGLASLGEETVPGARWLATVSRHAAASMAATGTLYSIAELRSPIAWKSRTGTRARYQYLVAAEATRLLRADLGQPGIVRILELMGGGRSFEDAYAVVAGRPFTAFADAFPQRIKALAATYPGIATSTDTVIGPGLMFVLYGFTPSTSIAVEALGPTGGSAMVTTADEFGARWFYLGPTFPPGSYSIRADGANGSASVVAVKVSPH